MKIIRIIIQGIIWIVPVFLFWGGTFMFVHPENKLIAFISCLIFGIYISSRLFEDAIKFGTWFDSHLKEKE